MTKRLKSKRKPLVEINWYSLAHFVMFVLMSLNFALALLFFMGVFS